MMMTTTNLSKARGYRKVLNPALAQELTDPNLSKLDNYHCFMVEYADKEEKDGILNAIETKGYKLLASTASAIFYSPGMEPISAPTPAAPTPQPTHKRKRGRPRKNTTKKGSVEAFKRALKF